MTIEFTVPYPTRKSAWTKRYGFNARPNWCYVKGDV